ncbi:DUF4105 domain-containing protein [Flavobacterium sp. RHBU_3]|uniref:lipoprotein N-acyltransferase Lnb domain-containing protein n=1 Tax=Flavobacterium sp. RHBU_3 TaxID=3391184 RepID=UPI0039855AF4
MRTLLKLRFPVLMLLLVLPIITRAQQLSDKAFVSLLTCGPGQELYSVFGHTAIRVADPATGLDVVFNYGTFDFSTPNFYLKFVKGDLQYFVSAASYNDFVYTYEYFNRDVFEQKLNLSQQQKQQVIDELAQALNSDKKYYTYKYFDRNCTTMVSDVLEHNLPQKISTKNTDEGKTYRKIVCERLHYSFYESLGINLMFGIKTDNKLHKLFLPEQLLQGVNNTTLKNGKALAEPTETVFKSTQQLQMSWWNNIYTFALACVVLIVLSKYIFLRRVLYALFGLVGVVFCFVGLYSFHTEVTWNYNALLVNPLFLVLLYFSFAHKPAALRKTAFAILGCSAVYLLFMLNKPHLLLVLPLLVTVVVLLLRELYPQHRLFSRKGKITG